MVIDRDISNRAQSARRRGRKCTFAVVTCLVFAAPAVGLPVSIKTIDTDAAAGTLRSFSLQSGLRWGDAAGGEHLVPADEVVLISTAREPQPPAHEHATLVLTGGGLLHGRIISGPRSFRSMSKCSRKL